MPHNVNTACRPTVIMCMTIHKLLMKWGIQEVKRSLCRCISLEITVVHFSYNASMKLNIS